MRERKTKDFLHTVLFSFVSPGWPFRRAKKKKLIDCCLERSWLSQMSANRGSRGSEVGLAPSTGLTLAILVPRERLEYGGLSPWTNFSLWFSQVLQLSFWFLDVLRPHWSLISFLQLETLTKISASSFIFFVFPVSSAALYLQTCQTLVTEVDPLAPGLCG